ncbi:MAG: YtxH domain-containing protein [Chryseobacterium sp.]|nr:YtxH domain-containing protein [Chryseobacterium sp.]
MGSKRNGLLALLGLSALAWWRYKKATPEEKQVVKDTINTAKGNLNKWSNDLKEKASDVASQVQSKVSEGQQKAEEHITKN